MTTITVRPPVLEDWRGPTGQEPYTWDGAYPGGYILQTTNDTPMRLPIDLLTPGRTYTVTMRCRADIWTNPVGVLEGVAKALPVDVYGEVSWTTRAARPVELVITGATRLNVQSVTITAEVPAHTTTRRPLPGDVLALDVATPRPGGDVFTLDASRLDRAALTVATPWPGTFVVGVSQLGGAYLYRADLTEWWTPILDGASRVTVRRGSSGTVVPTAEAGTLTAEFPGTLDPRAVGLRKGQAVRLYHWQDRRALFTGRLESAALDPRRPGSRPRFVTTLVAADAVAELAAVTRYGAVGTGGEAWTARAARLMASAPTVAWDVATAVAPAEPAMGDTVLESSLAAHLDVLAASARGAWWVDRDGVVMVCPGVPAGDVAATFTDATAAADVAPWPYVDALAAWSWDSVVSVVELNNLGAALNGEGEWVEANTTATATNTTLAATYGPQVVKLDTNLATEAAAAALATELAREQDSAAGASAVTVNGLADTARTAALELFTPVVAVLRGERRPALVASIGHTITPRAWTAQAELIERTAP